jgi:hypothetical protein
MASESNGPSVPSDLSKLTVPQLKALCKERRITGYSKLTKAAILQKLAEVAAPPKTTSRSATAVPSATTADGVATPPAYIESSTVRREGNVTKVVHQPVQPSTAGNTESTETSTAKAPLPTEVPKPSQNRTVISTTSTQKTSGTKRPAHIDVPAPKKRIRTSLKPATNVDHEPPVPKTSTFQQKLPVDSSAFKVPELPAQPKSSFHGSALTLAKQPSGPGKRSAVPCQTTGGPGRFKALVVSGPKPLGPDQANREPSRAPAVSVIPRAVDSALVSNFHPRPLPVLSHISFPPKASERKWVYRWAVILSSLSPADRQTCTLVSRTFRYAGRIIFLS